MSQKQRGLLTVALTLIGAMLLSACEISLSQPPAVTPSPIPTGLFVSPFPTGNPMDQITTFAAQTSAAQTAGTANVPPGTSAAVTGTVLTPQTGITATVTATPPIGTPSTPTNAVPGTPATVGPTITPGGPTLTPGPRPATYVLEKGEWPYCIARRFNVNPDELLSLSGLTTAQSNALLPGQRLTIPQTGNPFPADRSWHDHPDTYTVTSSSQTVYGVACYYGDIEPAVIAQHNGISVTSALTVNQTLNIP
jgi:hypothetical protein